LADLIPAQHEVVKSGYLTKSGKRNPKYNRYWFRLKGDVLTYYRDPSNLYFPHGQIDLRYAISANITDKEKEAVHFSVVTHNRTYNFRADSAPSAKEWVKSLQRVILRSHNDGDSVKISLPIDNVIDIEDAQIVEFAETCKIRVFDNDETYAMDEVRKHILLHPPPPHIYTVALDSTQMKVCDFDMTIMTNGF
jgi:sterol 3beta-glucosyltransferase